MSINLAFYQILEGVTAGDLAGAIGAAELHGPAKTVIADITAFETATPSALIYQSNPDVAKTLTAKPVIVITNDACLPMIDGGNSALIVPSQELGLHRLYRISSCRRRWNLTARASRRWQILLVVHISTHQPPSWRKRTLGRALWSRLALFCIAALPLGKTVTSDQIA